MICNLFFEGKVKKLSNIIKYEEDFVYFYLVLNLFQVEKFYSSDVENLLLEMYGKKDVKNNGITNYCYSHFKHYGDCFWIDINEKEQDYFKNVKLFIEQLIKIDEIDKSVLYTNVEKSINDSNIDFYKRLRNSLVLYYFDNLKSLFDIIKMAYDYYHLLKDYYKIYRIIDNKFEKISDIFNLVEITSLNPTEMQLSFLIYNNVFNIKNLKQMPINTIICIFCNDLDGFINQISNYAYSKKELIEELNSKFDSSLKPEWINIIEKRFDFVTNKNRTLADIGNELNLTRERIRQIEEKSVRILRRYTKELNEVIDCFYKDINKNNELYIDVLDLINYLNNEKFTRYLIIMLGSKTIDIVFDEYYGIIYSKKETSIERIIKESKDSLKDIITLNEYDLLKRVQRIIIDKEYKLFQNTLFIKKEYTTSDVYLNVIKDIFIHGYDIGSDEDYNQLKNVIMERYGEIKVSSKRSIYGMIERSNFIQIDKGKYISKEYAISLPEPLINEIIDYIFENAPIIPYNMVFEKYKNELKKYGVNNRFYLKGLIDQELIEEFSTDRDYIRIGDVENSSFLDNIIKCFKTFEGDFSIQDIKNMKPGLPDYTYDKCIRKEEKNGLLRISPKSYMYINKLDLNEDIIDKLKCFIDSLFEKLDSNVLSSKKIYSSLYFFNKDLLEKLKLQSEYGAYELFSIIQFLFKDYYYFSRPLISKEENFINSSYLLIKEYAYNLDKFSYSDLKTYVQRMNIGGLFSYLNFMEDLSDDYVQTSMSEMIKKELLKISEDDLKRIKDLLNVVTNEKEFNVNYFDGYFMLPQLEKSWNKYLLVGIVRTYFKNEFNIIYTTSFYNTTEFIIRRND